MQKPLALFVLLLSTLACYPDGSIEVTANESNRKNIRQISAGGSNFCYLAGNKLRCRGFDYAGLETLPFDELDEVAVSHTIGCFRKKDKVRCWNRDGLTQNTPVATGATKIAVSGDHTCAILSGKVRCWGEGSPSTTPSLGHGEATEIAVSPKSGCAIAGREFKCWGYRKSYSYDMPELKNPTNLTVSDHTACIIDRGSLLCVGKYATDLSYTPRLHNAIDVAAGYDHICAIVQANGQNEIVCWGKNTSGAASPPEDIVNPIAITAGDYFTCALSEDGTETCWGDNSFGQSATLSDLSQPVSLAVGSDHACSVDEDKSIACWGNNSSAQLMFPPLENPSRVAAFASRTCIINDDGPHCLGEGEYHINQVPDIDNSAGLAMNDWQACHITKEAGGDHGLVCEGAYDGPPEGEVVAGPPEVTNPTQIVAGRAHHCILDAGRVQCWGRNGYGQVSVPPLNNPTQVVAAYKYSCALDDGRVICWGTLQGTRLNQIKAPIQIAANNNAICGINEDGLTCVPVFPKPTTYSYADYLETGYPKLKNPKMITAGLDSFCAVDDFGTTCWGKNWGQYKFTTADPFRKGNQLPRDLVNPRQITVTQDNLCAVDDNGIECWGRGTDNSTITPDGTDIETVVTSGTGHCAVAYGKLKCWGSAGDLTFDHLPKPTSFATGSYGIFSSGYENHVCAIFGRELFCWTADEFDVCPARTSELSNPRLVAIGSTQTCAADDRGVSCWDSDSCRRIIVPAAVRNSTEVTQLESGSSNCAMVANEVVCWEQRTQSLRFVPDLNNPTRISVGMYNNCALDDTGAVCWQDAAPTDDPPSHFVWDIPALINPTHVAAGPRSCAIDQTGIVCWAGAYGSGYEPWPLPNVVFND